MQPRFVRQLLKIQQVMLPVHAVVGGNINLPFRVCLVDGSHCLINLPDLQLRFRCFRSEMMESVIVGGAIHQRRVFFFDYSQRRLHNPPGTFQAADFRRH